jgi:hypothetical protein
MSRNAYGRIRYQDFVLQIRGEELEMTIRRPEQMVLHRLLIVGLAA